MFFSWSQYIPDLEIVDFFLLFVFIRGLVYSYIRIHQMFCIFLLSKKEVLFLLLKYFLILSLVGIFCGYFLILPPPLDLALISRSDWLNFYPLSFEFQCRLTNWFSISESWTKLTLHFTFFPGKDRIFMDYCLSSTLSL